MSTLDILVWPHESGFLATVLGLPVPVVQATTREAAIQQAQDEAQTLLAKSEVVHVENGANVRKSKTLRVGPGMWKDNALYDEFVAAMKEARAEINANPNRL